MPGRLPSFLFDGEGFAIPAVGLIEVPPQLGHHSELVIRVRHTGPVPEFLKDGEGLAVPAVGLIEVPPVLGHHSEGCDTSPPYRAGHRVSPRW
jgi:hypothetical protein